jgi:hypothetical protein
VRRLVPLVLVPALVLAGCGDDGPDDDERAATFCTRLERLTENDPFAAFGDRATAPEIETAFQALVDRAQELVDTAPEEAEANAREYADAAEGLDSILAGAAYDGSQVDQRAYREEQTKYVQAATRLERYLTSEC